MLFIFQKGFVLVFVRWCPKYCTLLWCLLWTLCSESTFFKNSGLLLITVFFVFMRALFRKSIPVYFMINVMFSVMLCSWLRSEETFKYSFILCDSRDILQECFNLISVHCLLCFPQQCYCLEYTLFWTSFLNFYFAESLFNVYPIRGRKFRCFLTTYVENFVFYIVKRNIQQGMLWSSLSSEEMACSEERFRRTLCSKGSIWSSCQFSEMFLYSYTLL